MKKSSPYKLNVRSASAIFTVTCLYLSIAQAGDSTWSGSVDTDFNKPSNWVDNGDGQGPSVTTGVAFDGDTVTSEVTANTTAKTLGVNSAGDVTLDVDDEKVLTVSGPATNSDAALTVEGTSSLTVSGAGQLDVVKGQTHVGVGSGESGTLIVDGGTANFGTAVGEGGDFARVVIGGSEGTGTLNLNSGTVMIGNELSAAETPLEYGSIRVGLGAGAVGVVNQTGGTFDASYSGSLAIGQDGGTGTYNLSSGAAIIGGGKQTFFHVGRGNGTLGTLNLSGDATFNIGVGSEPEDYAFFYVGSQHASAEGHVNQSGTSIFTAERTLLYIGNDDFNATGTYTIGDSAQLISTSSHPSSSGDRIRLGTADGGTGTFNQNGSSLVDLQNGGKVNIVGATSAYNLNGGTLQVGGENGIRGDGAFNLGGGTIKVIESDLTSSVDATLVDSTASTVDTNGLNATLSGDLTGTGALAKTGSGGLTLSGSNSFGILEVDEGSTAITGTTTLNEPTSNSNPALTVNNGSSLTVDGAGELNVVKGQTRVGYGSGEMGSLTVDGGTANLGTATGESYDFARTVIGGDGGTGTLNLEEGTIQIGNAGTGTGSDNYGSLRIGLDAGSVGVFNQNGGVFNAENSGSMSIGQDGGTGTYTLSSGSAVLGGLKKFHLHVGRNNSLGNFNISGDATVQMGSASPLDPSADGYAFFHVGNYGTDPVGHVTQSGSSTFTTERTLIYMGNVETGTGSYTIGDDAQLISLSSHPSSSGDRIRLGFNDETDTATGMGTFTQNGNSLVDLQDGGKVNIVGNSSAYNLNGGTLQVGGDNGIHGDGAFNLGGGTIKVIESDLTSSVDTQLVAGTTSTVDTNSLGATFSGDVTGEGNLVKRGAGTMTLTGVNDVYGISTFEGTAAITSGTHTVDKFTTGAFSDSGSHGTLDVSGGTIHVTGVSEDYPAFYIGGGSTTTGKNEGFLNFSAGTINIGEEATPNGRADMYVGGFGGADSEGTVTQTGGTVNKFSENGVLHIGNQSTGTYNLQDGAMYFYGNNGMVLGRSGATHAGTGTLNVSGGTLIFNDGTDLLLGGAQDSEPETGSGTVNQTDGTVSLKNNGNMVIGQRGGGVYNLDGGVLEVSGSINRNTTAGSSNLNLGGGTLRAIESDLKIASGVITTLAAFSNTTIDTNGFDVVIEDGLSGTGTFTKVNSGNFELGGTTTLSGTSVNAGDGNIVIGSAAAGTGVLNLNTGAALNSDDSTGSGSSSIWVGDGGRGTVNIDGGSIDLRYYANNVATFLVGANGGDGTVNMNDGLITVTEGSAGAYSVIVVGALGGTGEFNQRGGTINQNGLANLQVGTFSGTGTFSMTNDSVFTQNNATNFIGEGATGNATVNFLDNASFEQTVTTDTYVAQSGALSVINQNDASNVTWRGFFLVGRGSGADGTYNLIDGNLSFDSAYVNFGYDETSSGTLNQLGGVLSANGSSFTIGREGDGDYAMSNGQATFNVGLVLAAAATSRGTVNQTGGTVTVGSGQKLSFGSGTGTYNLEGGTLAIGGTNGISQGAGSASIHLGGGTIKVIESDLSTSVDMTTVDATTSVIDTNGNNASFNGAFGGTGLVRKSGAGSMSVNSTTSTADFEVTGGTLDGLGATTGSIAVSAGGTLAGGISVGGTTTIQSGAAHAPGFSPGAVYSAGSYLLSDGATLYLELGGLDEGSGSFTSPSTGDFDQLLYGGGITIEDNANLVISSYNTYVPEIGDRFNILLTDEVIAFGSGVNVTGSGLLSGFSFSVTEESGQSFGGTSGLNALQLTVIPEPATWVMMVMVIGLGFVTCRRRVRPMRKK
ncbi:hypothetical protein P3T73_02335 [Kiritimatiellota bacterium B12222]|nr:hypothetical protein P3T73_02335 [Kiritimatiellota bacterium B12222]